MFWGRETNQGFFSHKRRVNFPSPQGPSAHEPITDFFLFTQAWRGKFYKVFKSQTRSEWQVNHWISSHCPLFSPVLVNVLRAILCTVLFLCAVLYSFLLYMSYFRVCYYVCSLTYNHVLRGAVLFYLDWSSKHEGMCSIFDFLLLHYDCCDT